MTTYHHPPAPTRDRVLVQHGVTPRGKTVRDSKGKAYIVWHDGSIRNARKVIASEMRKMNPVAQTEFGLAVAKLAGEALNAQDAAQEGAEG